MEKLKYGCTLAQFNPKRKKIAMYINSIWYHAMFLNNESNTK